MTRYDEVKIGLVLRVGGLGFTTARGKAHGKA